VRPRTTFWEEASKPLTAVRILPALTLGDELRGMGGTVVFVDRTLTCRDCAETFVFTAGEQTFFASKGLVHDPARCPTCRAQARRARTNGDGPREYHAAICSGCGGQARVPFAPRPDKPVYCSACFEQVRAAASAVGSP
jgi:CxxC-x17-CxxC domain-containing protein